MSATAAVEDWVMSSSGSEPTFIDAELAGSGGVLFIPEGLWLSDAGFSRAGADLIVSSTDGAVVAVVHNYFMFGAPALSNGHTVLGSGLITRR